MVPLCFPRILTLDIVNFETGFLPKHSLVKESALLFRLILVRSFTVSSEAHCKSNVPMYVPLVTSSLSPLSCKILSHNTNSRSKGCASRHCYYFLHKYPIKLSTCKTIKASGYFPSVMAEELILNRDSLKSFTSAIKRRHFYRRSMDQQPLPTLLNPIS